MAKRSESPNSFLDQESRRREEEESVYCTTPTYGMQFVCMCVCVCEGVWEKEIQSHSAVLKHFKKSNHESASPPASLRQLLKKFENLMEPKTVIRSGAHSKSLKLHFFLIASRRQLHLLSKAVQLHMRKWLFFSLIHYLRKWLSNKFVSIANFKSPPVHDVYFVNYGPI